MPPEKNKDEVKEPQAGEAASAEEQEEQSEFDFLNDMDYDDDDTDIDTEEVTSGTEDDEEPTPEEGETVEDEDASPPEEPAEPAEPAVAEEPKEKKEEKTPPQPEQPRSAPEEAASAGDPDLNTQFEEFFNKSAETLAERVYSLSDEEKKALDEEPSKMLPQLAGRLHMQILTAAVTQAANLMPHFVQQTQVRNTEEERLETQFFDSFPKLREHPDEVMRVAKAYRQAYPDLDSDTMMKEVGAAVSIRLKIPTPGQESTPPQPAAETPPVPSAARGSTTPPATPAKQSWLEEILQEED